MKASPNETPKSIRRVVGENRGSMGMLSSLMSIYVNILRKPILLTLCYASSVYFWIQIEPQKLKKQLIQINYLIKFYVSSDVILQHEVKWTKLWGKMGIQERPSSYDDFVFDQELYRNELA